MNKKTCKCCGKILVGKRADAVYCDDACRKKGARNHKKDSETIAVEAEVFYDSPSTEKPQEVIETESLKNSLIAEITKCENDVNQLLHLKKNAEIDKEKQRIELSLLKKKKVDSIQTFILNSKNFEEELQKKKRVNSEQKMGMNTSELSTLTLNQLLKSLNVQQLYSKYKADFPKNLENEIKNLLSLISSKSLNIKDFADQIKRLDKNKAKLNERLDKLLKSYLSVWEHNHKKPQSNQKNEVSDKSPTNSNPVEILNPDISFEILNFQDEGRYLGNVSKHKAFIFLTGEAGAGKTHLSFLLLKSFIKEKLICAYLSLEEGSGIQKKTNSLGLKLSDFSLYEKANINDLRTICKKGGKNGVFDAVFIDSWQKLDADSKEVDQLRADFPQIIFVSISQVTKNGSMQGKNALYHDATAILLVSRNKENKRSVTVSKTRYGNIAKIYDLKNSLNS